MDVLGWEFAFELHETTSQFAVANQIELKFKKISREVLEKRAVEQGDIYFFELAAMELTVSHEYPESGRYSVMVKVIDILGNDTTKFLEVEV